MIRFPNNSFRFLTCLILLMTVSSSVQAQRRSGSELDLLRSEDVLREIGVSDDVIDRIFELRRTNTTTRAAFEEFKEELRAAETDEQRTAIRQKIQDRVKSGGQKFREQAIQLLAADQQAGLRRVYIENVGTRALNDDRVAADLKLSDEQREKIRTLFEERRERSSSDELSEQEREAANANFEKNILAVLTPGQNQQWKIQSGVQPAADSESEAQPETAGDSSKPESLSSSPQNDAPPEDQVASFGSTSDRRRVERYSFNFRRAPWERVLQLFADGAGLTLDMQRVPPGSLTHLDNKTYSAAKALDIINGYLIRKGFSVVRKDGFLVVVNLDEQLDQSLVPEVSRELLMSDGENLQVGDNQLVTIRIPVEGLDTARTAQEIEALLGPWGSMIALTQSQLIMVSDVGANLRRIVRLIDSAARPDELAFRSYFLQHIDVEEAEPLLLTQFGMRQMATNVSAASEARRDRDRRSPSPAPQTATPAGDIQVASDVRTNSLLITATAAQHALVETILSAIDVSESPDGTSLSRTGRRGKFLRVYTVNSSDTREVTKTLDAIMPGVVVNEDGYNEKIHVMATEREHEEIESLIRQLDGAGSRNSVAVIPLIKMDPMIAAATLRSLFINEGDGAPTIETDLYGRRLIVRGAPDQVAQIRAVLVDLGEDGSGQRPPSQGGLRRQYSLQGRSPNEFLRIMQDTWQDSEPNPIRIIVPNRTGPVRERRTLDGSIDEEDKPSDEQPTTDHDSVPARQFYTSIQDETAEATSAPVTITVLGDDLLLSSEDPEALDRLEDLLDSLQQTLPYRTRWTVFYLQSADATEAADLLAQIFPSSSVASTAASTGGSIFGSLANSFSGLGSSIADATGLTSLGENPQGLRIIPDVRSNSLLIAGPDAVLQDVWGMLQVLDSDDVPESFRDMEQRAITVQHADINNVASIVRDVFKPLMETQKSGSRQAENPFSAMFGGGGKQSRQVIRMTLGVDQQTSSLIISSSKEICEDVKELVETLDKNSKDADRRIRVVPLQYADPSLVQRSLTNLFPRVKTTVTSSRTSGMANGGTRTDGNADAKGQNPQRQQQEQRFREEMLKRWQERAKQRGQGGGRPGTEGERRSNRRR